MNEITRFEINNLHEYRNPDFRIKDNTLVIVGENVCGGAVVGISALQEEGVPAFHPWEVCILVSG